MLRFATIIFACALAAPSAFAQTAKDLVYPTAPAGLSAPNSATAADLRAAAGNLDRWAKAERARLGPCETNDAYKTRIDQWTATAKATKMPDKKYYADYPKRDCPAIADIEGYFLHNTGDPKAMIAPGAIVAARWTGGETLMLSKYSPISGYCAADIAAAPQPSPQMDTFTYLGPKWNDAWTSAVLELFPSSSDAANAINRDIKTVTPKDYGRTVGKVYPSRALDREKSGDATVACIIGDSATPACVLISESPTGWGFGAAALTLSTVVAFDAAAAPSSGRCAIFPLAFRIS